jgi:hypothetical protein
LESPGICDIGEENGKPQPNHDLEGEAEMIGSIYPIADEKERR